MTNYPQLQEHVNRLSELLTLIEAKDKEIIGGTNYNNNTVFAELRFDIPELRKELKALKKEYRDLTRKIQIS